MEGMGGWRGAVLVKMFCVQWEQKARAVCVELLTYNIP